MKMFIVLAACVAIAVAAPQFGQNQQEVVLLKETLHDNIGVGGYSFGYELSDGQSRQETAELRNAGSEDAFLVVRGSYTLVDPATGQQYTVNYVADENGFHPEGAHLPV